VAFPCQKGTGRSAGKTLWLPKIAGNATSARIVSGLIEQPISVIQDTTSKAAARQIRGMVLNQTETSREGRPCRSEKMLHNVALFFVDSAILPA
jgi:hypothetical protein